MRGARSGLPQLRSREARVPALDAHARVGQVLRRPWAADPERKEQNPMRQEDKPVARPESQGKPAKNDPGLADEVYIPDYVMLDFGTPGTTSTAG
jgi:hypothetical protein